MMPLSLRKPSVVFQASAGGGLLGSFALDSVYNERWPILVLALFSMLMIFLVQQPRTENRSQSYWYTVLAVACLSVGALFDLDKFVLLSGAIFLGSATLRVIPMPKLLGMLTILCGILIVPLPASLETELAAMLAAVEASIFVVIGQALDVPVRLSGAQVFFDQSVVTINQDCSGTLLLVPALLGALVAVAYAKSKHAALASVVLSVPLALLINIVRLAVVLALIATDNFKKADVWHDYLGFLALTISWVLPLMLFADLGAMKVAWYRTRKLVLPMLVATATGGVAVSISSIEPTTSSQVLSPPNYISGWVAEPVSIPASELRILNANQVVRQKYTTSSNQILVTTMYHHDPKVGREHSSERCFKAMGWQVSKLGHQIPAKSGRLTQLVVQSGGHRQSVLELEIENALPFKGFVRIQLVSDSTLPFTEKEAFLDRFAAKLIGEAI